MTIIIKEHHNGFSVELNESFNSLKTYVYKSNEDLVMLEDIAKKVFKRRIKIEEQ